MRSTTGARALLAAALAGLAYVVLNVSGAVSATNDSLGAMGFDPDRSELITALAISAAVVAIGIAVTGRTWGAAVAGLAVFVLLFRRTFEAETARALSPSAAGGQFDALGWATTVGVLAVVVLVVAVATTLLVAAARQAVLGAVKDAARIARTRQPRSGFVRPVATLVAVLVVIAALPVFGDMVNDGPDVRMVSGGAPAIGLNGDASGSEAPPPALPPGPSAGQPSGILAVPGGADPVSGARPWLAWQPSGSGNVSRVALPAPWKGGSAATAAVFIYTPPGYGAGTRTYPTIYEVPWAINGYESYLHITRELDGLIDSGAIAPELVVFIAESGGPYHDSECVNSADGREWFERYVVSTVVPYVDQHYRTIGSPRARALLGFSQGGYCAAMLLLRHPNTFTSAVVFSGYFQAAPRSSQTPNAWRPYGGDLALIAATSPVTLASHLTSTVAPSLFVEMSGDPAEAFYGPQYVAFSAALHASGVAVALFPTPLGHAWAAMRAQLPTMLETLSAREVATGVFAR